MTIDHHTLLQELQDITTSNIDIIDSLSNLDEKRLHQHPNPNSWSALECIEHLNRYSAFYIPEINSVLDAAKDFQAQPFKSGILGNYFANAMRPQAPKMKTFKSMNTLGCNLSTNVIDVLKKYQEDTLNIIDRCQNINLNKVKTSITISSLIRLKLGDTLRVVIYHNQRHLEQAERAVELGG